MERDGLTEDMSNPIQELRELVWDIVPLNMVIIPGVMETRGGGPVMSGRLQL